MPSLIPSRHQFARLNRSEETTTAAAAAPRLFPVKSAAPSFFDELTRMWERGGRRHNRLRIIYNQTSRKEWERQVLGDGIFLTDIRYPYSYIQRTFPAITFFTHRQTPAGGHLLHLIFVRRRIRTSGLGGAWESKESAGRAGNGDRRIHLLLLHF